MSAGWPDLSKIRGPLNTGGNKDFKSLGDYYYYMKNDLKSLPMSSITVNSFVVFNYTAKGNPKEGDLQRWAFVLHPNYEGKMHALELSLIDLDVGVSPPWFSLPEDGKFQFKPYNFYHKVAGVQEFIKEHDAYRTYIVDRISNMRVYGGVATTDKNTANPTIDLSKSARAIDHNLIKNNEGISE